MAIDTSLLIAAPMLQDYFVDKSTGTPLAGGIVTCYQDNSRTTLKNWYYQSGSPGSYTYVPLPNPMVLSGVGTIVDVNGNDTIPFFYPYSETDNQSLQPYYITVDSYQGQRQFTRQNFPFLPQQEEGLETPTLKNYIVNNQFWRNIGTANVGTLTNTISLSGSNYYYETVSPSQHDGFTMPDIIYLKNVNGATETVTFNKFPLGFTPPLQDDITPEYYLNHNCTAAQTGETIKVYQFPISLHVNTLDSVTATITLQAQNVGDSVNNQISLFIYQYLGTGVTSPAPIELTPTINLSNSWQKFIIPVPTLPSTAGLTLSSAGDDALYLQIGLPTGVTCDINFTLPSIYLSENVPTNNFTTYDEVNAIISSPRTGDVRTSINSFNPFGWVLCNDGVLSNVTNDTDPITLPSNIPSARQNQDAWKLYDLLWNIAKPFDTGSDYNPICQMYDHTGAATNYGSSSYNDWLVNDQLQLSLTAGRAFLGLPPVLSVTYTYNAAPSWNVGANGYFTAVNNFLLYPGAPVSLSGTLPPGGPFTANTIYYAIPAIDGSSSTQFQLASSYNNAINGAAITAGGASGNGSNIVVNFALGGYFGQPRHTQLVNEIAAHHHSPSVGAFVTNQAGSSVLTGTGAQTTLAVNNTANTGNSNPFNVIQPSVYYNIFFKL